MLAVRRELEKEKMIMGTPEKITLDVKIGLLNIGKEIGKNLDVGDLPSILGKVKRIILPLVEWFDKSAPAKKRGLLFFSSSFLHIWLERSGKWFINFGIHNPGGEEKVFYASSQELAKIMIERQEDFLNLYPVGRDFLKELPFLKDILLYDVMVLRVLAQFFEDVEKQFQEREERIRLMRERLNLFGDFSQSLDPLISQGKAVLIKGYSIFEDHDRGTSRCTEDYLCPEALESFWKVLDSRQSGRQGYKEFISEYRCDSLERILQRVRWIVEEISKAGTKDAKSLFGYSSGRLPFTAEELNILKKLVDSITT